MVLLEIGTKKDSIVQGGHCVKCGDVLLRNCGCGGRCVYCGRALDVYQWNVKFLW